MNRKKAFSLSNHYKRFFMWDYTALIATLASILLMPVILYFARMSGEVDWSVEYNLLVRAVLVVTLFYALRTHKLFLMQAALVGLLFSILSWQSQYALGELARKDSETFITMGLQGLMFLAGERMLLFMQSFFCVSHFIINAVRRQEAIRVSVNQAILLFLIGLLIVQSLIAPALTFGRDYIIYVLALHMDELFNFILAACAELIIMIDQREIVGG